MKRGMVENPKYEHELARNWRERNHYTREKMAELTGYSVSMILDIENGCYRGNHARPIELGAMTRYRLSCAAIEKGLTEWAW